MATCPAGHTSTADDYCDVCGMPITAGSPPGPGGPASPAAGGTGPATGAVQACPHCETPNAVDALFCEACGYDFTTGSVPRPLTPPEPPAAAATAVAPASSGGGSAAGPTRVSAPASATAAASEEPAWVVELWVDPTWYAAQESPDPLPSAGLPAVSPLRGRSLLVGRTSQSRNIHPDVDCGSDSGVSRRQCQLSTDGTRWWVEDLDSANGTFVGPASGPLPVDPLPVGQRHELRPDDRIYVGAWTRLVIRAATDDERAGLG